MSLLSFKRSNNRQFELFIGPIGTGMLWPSTGLLEWMDRGGHLVQSGLDVEAEYIAAFVDDFVKEWTPYAMNLPMTRLEILIAYSEAKSKLPPKGVLTSRP